MRCVSFQDNDLVEHIENLTFQAGENGKIHFAKQELLSQIKNLRFTISGNKFFILNRGSLANVSLDSVVP